MRATHNTPIPPEEPEFPIPDDCACEDGVNWCTACQRVLAELLARQDKEERSFREHDHEA